MFRILKALIPLISITLAAVQAETLDSLESVVYNRVAYIDQGDLYTMNADGSDRAAIVSEVIGEPAISPDGSKIAFVLQPDENYEIFVVNSDGSSMTRITDGIGGGSAMYLSWSPSGDRLAFLSRGNDSPDIFTINADGSNLTNITNTTAREVFPMWSPDSEQIAFKSDRDGSAELYTINADGSNYTRLTYINSDNSMGSLTRPVWSPDGTQIVFNNYPHLSRINADGTGLFQIVTDAVAGYAMWFTNDLLVYRLREAKWVAINADGTNRRLVNLDWPDDVTYFSIPANWQPPDMITTQPPTADAGEDQTVTVGSDGLAIVRLNAGASTLGDGELSSINWYKGEDLMIVSLIFSTELSLEVGVHTFTVQVYTNRGLTATDDVTVTVLPAEQTPIPAVTPSPSPTTP